MQNDELQLAVTAISHDDIVGIPTETVYGIGVNPNSQDAVDKIFQLKERDEDKSCPMQQRDAILQQTCGVTNIDKPGNMNECDFMCEDF